MGLTAPATGPRGVLLPREFPASDPSRPCRRLRCSWARPPFTARSVPSISSAISATGPSPVDRRKMGSKHHLICDGRGTPLHVITTAANVNGITQTLDLVDASRPSPDDPVGPRLRPECLLGDEVYDSKAVRGELDAAASRR
ncbi:transposase [Streptomyces avermitilis]|uniref:transposase n=1 Tax=Streptomyces avermitilis TaxID=33903 RepID=UPI0036B8610A